jgi:3-carboxy-cis,cis-muconate cycloisomerase
VQATGAALSSVADAVSGLVVDPERMRANLDATRGVIFAERAMMLLAPALGRDAARRIIEGAVDAATSGEDTFAHALAANADAARVLGASELATLDSPEAYLGAAEELRKTLLANDDL